MTLKVITGNSNKFKEIQLLFPDAEQIQIDLPEIQHHDPEEIAREKLRVAMSMQEGDFIVEDVSLHMDCLNGLPGPLIKWFLDQCGVQRIYAMAQAIGNQGAQARCTIGLAKDGEMHFFEGIVPGKIVSPIDTGFGFDKIFLPDGHEKLYGEMTPEEKFKISHRALALRKLQEFLNAS